LETLTAGQGGYVSWNCFAGFTTTTKEYVSDDNTAKTITGTINSHSTNLYEQMAASIEDNTSQANVSFQQLTINNTQLQQQQQAMM
jgi:hypothetical protein